MNNNITISTLPTPIKATFVAGATLTIVGAVAIPIIMTFVPIMPLLIAAVAVTAVGVLITITVTSVALFILQRKSRPLASIPTPLTNLGKKVGETKILHIQDQTEQSLSIYKWKDETDKVHFDAYTDVDGTLKKVGDMSLQWFRLIDTTSTSDEYGTPDFKRSDSNWTFRFYGLKDKAGSFPSKDLSKIYLCAIDSDRGGVYKGIGTALMQVAMEYGYNPKRNCEGRIQLHSIGNSQGFYYIQKMRTMMSNQGPAEVDKFISDELEAAKREKRPPLTEDLIGVEMYMPEDGIAHWKGKIAQDPILFKSRV